MRQFDRSDFAQHPREVRLSACLLIFWCVGPATGHLATIIVSSTSGFDPPGYALLDALKVWALLYPIILPVVWIAGTVPAIIAAVVYWAFPRGIGASGIAAIATSGVVGAAACAGMVVVLTGRVLAVTEAPKIVSYILPGAVGGLMSALTMEWLRHRWRNAEAG